MKEEGGARDGFVAVRDEVCLSRAEQYQRILTWGHRGSAVLGGTFAAAGAVEIFYGPLFWARLGIGVSLGVLVPLLAVAAIAGYRKESLENNALGIKSGECFWPRAKAEVAGRKKSVCRVARAAKAARAARRLEKSL